MLLDFMTWIIVEIGETEVFESQGETMRDVCDGY